MNCRGGHLWYWERYFGIAESEFFYRNTKYRSFDNFTAVQIPQVGTCGKKVWKVKGFLKVLQSSWRPFKARELGVCGFYFFFSFILVPCWTFAVFFYRIPQFLGKYRYRNTECLTTFWLLRPLLVNCWRVYLILIIWCNATFPYVCHTIIQPSCLNLTDIIYEIYLIFFY